MKKNIDNLTKEDDKMISSSERLLQGKTLDELEKVAKGPSRTFREENNLDEAILAIEILADRAKTEPAAVERLLLVIQDTNWWDTIEKAIREFLKVADVDQLQKLASYLYDSFYQPGDYGGGFETPQRLKKVSDRLEELKISIYDLFPPENRGGLDYLLKDLPNSSKAEGIKEAVD